VETGNLADLSDVLTVAAAILDWMLEASSTVRYPWACRKSMFARVCETMWKTKAESDMGERFKWFVDDDDSKGDRQLQQLSRL